ncbi:MAG TPA: cupredoxin domain-containing protein [Acidimicrobiales bacterium]
MQQASRARGRRWWAVLAAPLALTLLVASAACGDDDDDTSSDTTESGGGGGGGADATVEIVEFQYSDVTVPAGGTIEVINSSGATHTFTADDGEFDEEVGDGETVTVDAPAEAGDYPFHCEIHPSMTATLTVE